MTVHELKIWPAHFADVVHGLKTCEVRKDDRAPEYAAGDKLLLAEWDPETASYTGHEAEADVTHVLRETKGVTKGYAVLSIRVVSVKLHGS